MKRLMLIILLSAGLALPAWAGLDKGTAAYKRGDFATALNEFLAAAKNGEARAEFSLGLMHLRGQGVKRSNAKAMDWLRKAAERGDGEARMVLGDLYGRGQPPQRDYVKSLMWFELALVKIRGPKRNLTFRLRAATKAEMTDEQIARAKRMVREWRSLHRQTSLR